MSSPSPSPLRVLHITASSMIGGGPEHVWQLVRHLPTHITSFIAAPDCLPYGPRFTDAVGSERCFILPQRKFSLLSFWKLVQCINMQHIDIVHSHGKGAGIYGRPAALLSHTASVHTFHGIHLPSHLLDRQGYLAVERTLCHLSRACIAVSEGEAAQARELGLGRDTVIVIPNGVEMPAVCTVQERPTPFTLVHISRFDSAQKNSLWLAELAVALHTAGRLSACHVVLVGDGEERAELERRVRQLGLADAFTFAGSQPTVLPFLRTAGCLLSCSRWEGLPLAVLEAQAEGVPAIVSDVVGNRDAIVDGVTGFTYPLNDADSATNRIGRLLDDKDLWLSMSRAAREHIQNHFTVEHMAQSTAQVYHAAARHA